MNHTADIINYLSSLGVKISVEGGDLVCRAPKSIATQEVRDLIAANKPSILDYLAVSSRDQDDFAPDLASTTSAKAMQPPPPGCIAATHACPILGPCERHLAGLPCLAPGAVNVDRPRPAPTAPSTPPPDQVPSDFWRRLAAIPGIFDLDGEGKQPPKVEDLIAAQEAAAAVFS